MPYNNLREFITELEKNNELKRINIELSPELELTEIADRVCKINGPALFFEKIHGYNIPVLMNAFGSEKRMKLALSTDNFGSISERILDLLDKKVTLNLIDKIKMISEMKYIADAFPGEVNEAPCQEIIIESPSFHAFPIIKCWPKDGGKYITLPLVFTIDPETGVQNCGIYRMQIYDETTAGMHWHIHKGGAQHYRKYEVMNKRMPVSVAVGADPVVTFCGVLPLPENIDEMLIAGLIRGKGIKLVKSKTNDILVPAEAEIIFEGYIEPFERKLEGPFGDHTGFYSLEGDFPVFHLKCITHRKNPIYQATVVGRPQMEDCYIGMAIEQLFLPVIQKQLPEIVDMHMPFAGVFHNLILVSIKKNYPGQARKVMHALWGTGQAMFSKVIIVVDNDINLRDYNEVCWKVLNNIEPERDMEFVKGPLDELNYASSQPLYGSKVGIDATRKFKEEGFSRQLPDEIKMDKTIINKINQLWNQFGL